MNDRLLMPTGIAIGAGLMYLMDPDRGKRRRARIRDEVTSSWHRTNHLLAKARRDAENRTLGLIAETRAMMHSGPVPDEVLEQRVRSRIGRYVSHPRALTVSARNGKIYISGPILKHEVDPVLAAIVDTPGVKEVEPTLEIHEHPDGIPALQGGRKRPGERPDFLQENWAPATRVIGTIAGGALVVTGARTRGPLGLGIGAGGLALAVRSITNYPFKLIIGARPVEKGIEVHKSININAPVEVVFQLWANPENYPLFMEHVQDVRKTKTGQYHWVVDGPAGTTVSWNAVITEYKHNDKLAWKTVPGTQVEQTGFTRFVRNEDGSTRIDVHMSYVPPGGLVGHTVASIFESDPKTEMDEDLVRFKSLLEHGKTTAKGRTVTRDELVADLTQPVELPLFLSSDVHAT